MGNRLSKIVTRTGDDGTTGLGDGNRILKFDPRMKAIGDVDELNCVVGLVLAELSGDAPLLGYDADDVDPTTPIGYNELIDVQHRLFDLGGELSIPNHIIIDGDDSTHLETILEGWNSTLPYLKNFILPGGTELVARLHQARAVCRRAERSVIELDYVVGINNRVNSESIKYLNRLSDFLFVLARVHSQGKEVLWKPKENV